MQIKKNSHSLFRRSALSVAVGLLVSPAPAHAVTWGCANSYWDYSECWSPNGVPNSGDSVRVFTVGGADTVLKIDDITGNAYARTLEVGAATGTTVTLQQSGGNLSAEYEYIGYVDSYGNGINGTIPAGSSHGSSTFNQSGGTNTVGTDLNLGGAESGMDGTYTLSGGTLNVGRRINASYGSSTFNLDGGTLNVTGSSIELDYFNIGNAFGSNGSFTLRDGQTLTVSSEIIGNSGTGTLTQSGGTNTLGSSLQLGVQSGSSGSYTLSGGTLDIGGNIVGGAGSSTFNLDGGTLIVSSGSITLDNFNIGNAAGSNGSFTLVSGQTLTAGNETLGNNGIGTFTQSGGTNTVENLAIHNGTYTLAGGTLTVNTGLDNSDAFVLTGGTLNGSGALVNNGQFSGFGTIAGSGGFVNNALLTQSGGNLTLANTDANANYGNIDLETGHQLRLNGATLSNGGTLNLNGAVVTGTGTLDNSYGGVIAGRGTISSNFNNSGGVLAVVSGTTNITKAFSNGGAIQLGGATANLTGGVISNTGTIEGVGSVGNSIINSGIVRANNGTLTLSGASVSNNAGGLITAATGGTVLAVNGVNTNAGVINLNGGAFDNNNHALTSTGQISGYGTLRTGGLSNHGSMIIVGGNTTINGAVTNEVGANINVTNSPAIFTGNVVNNGVIKTTNTSVTFAGSYTENGTYSSDPSNNYFTNVTIGTNGFWVGGTGDNFFISGNFTNNSLQNSAWDTTAASLSLTGGANHLLTLAGADNGALLSGYNNNFAWGSFSLDKNASLNILDGNTTLGAALYVGEFELGGGLAQLSSIHSDFNIYYDASLASNAWLGGKTYALNGAGFLEASAVPVPASVWLFGSGLLGLAGTARRRTLSI